MYLEIIQAFILLLVIIDPLISMNAFHVMTKEMDPREKKKTALKAVAVAAIPLFLFILGGPILFEMLRIDMSTFKAAGGLILILLGTQLSLGVHITDDGKDAKNKMLTKTTGAVASIIGTPLITGPASISAAVILTADLGMEVAIFASICALFVAYIALNVSSKVFEILNDAGLRIISNMLGVITIAWGMSFLKEGLLMIV